MTEQTSAVATRKPDTGVEVAQDVRVMSIAGREGVERYETVVTIPKDYQYAIPIRGAKHPDGSWDNTKAKVALLSDAYDYLNRVIGVTFWFPKEVHDEHGVMQPNPIHRSDYIYLRVAGVWYNPMGQMVSAVEDVEVDFKLIWMDARVNAKSAKPVLDPASKQITFDNLGNPMLQLSEEDELKALKELTRLRRFGPRYAFTVGRTRILKQASGIRSVPGNVAADFRVKVVGYRDKMEVHERIAQVAGDAEQLYGERPADIPPLSKDEMAEVHQSEVLSDAAEVEDAELAHIEQSGQGAAAPAPSTAPVGTAICGVPTGPTADGKGQEVCLVIVDAERKHPGPHKSANHVIPQG